MNVKVVSGSAAGFHINTVTYRESRSFFFTWRVAHGLSSVVKMLADSVWIITRTFSSNNDLCCFKTEQLLCPSLKGTPWRFPQNKKKKVFSPRNRPCVSFIHNKHAECFSFPRKRNGKVDTESNKTQLPGQRWGWLESFIPRSANTDVLGWRSNRDASPTHQYLTFAPVVTAFVRLCLLTSCLPPPCFLLEHLFSACYPSISGMMLFCSS